MHAISKFLTSRWGPILTGIVVGVLAPLLVKFGNPGNMGICVACFNRDIAGALGIHRAATVQYIRPEIIGFVLGSVGLVVPTVLKDFHWTSVLFFVAGLLLSLLEHRIKSKLSSQTDEETEPVSVAER